MRLMTGVAERAAGVFGRHYLGEASGFGRVFFVAAPAEVGHVRQLRLVRRRVVRQGVDRLRSMAGFAGDVCVLSRCARFGLVVVAHDALVLPGVGNGAGADPFQGGRVVVPVFAKGFRNERGADHQKDGESGQQNGRGTDQVSRIPKKLTQRHYPPFQGTCKCCGTA